MALTKVRRFPPSRWGKLSTFAQIVAAVAWMVDKYLAGPCFTCNFVRNALG